MTTFRLCNPGVSHLVFDETTAEAFIGRHFTDREVAAFQSCAVPAMQADYFRYCAVLALGGLYSDVGWICVESVGPLIPGRGGGRLFLAPAGHLINGIFAFGSPGHDLLRIVLDVATANIESRISDQVYFTTGVPIFMLLLNLPRFGSFETAIARCQGTHMQDLVHSYCETIGDYARAERALAGVELSRPEQYHDFIRPGPRVTSEERGSPHWSKTEGPIFR